MAVNKMELDEEFRRLKAGEAPINNVGPGLPEIYNQPKKKQQELPDSPFEELNPNQLVVMCEGFSYSGMIEIPESAKRSNTAGYVIAASAESKYKRNQRILFTQFAGTKFVCDGLEGLRTLTEAEVIGILKPRVRIEEAE